MQHQKFVCDSTSFLPTCHNRVQWLDWTTDYPLIQQAWAEAGVDLTYEQWLEARDQGYTYCGIVDNDVLISVAAVWTYANSAWEVAAVGTALPYRQQGLAKAVVSFATAHIIHHGKLATCHTREDNHAMQKVATAVGFRLASEH